MGIRTVPDLPQHEAALTDRRRNQGELRYAAPSVLADHSETEAAFWQRLEAREDGRFTQEADHLFDTSHSWAA